MPPQRRKSKSTLDDDDDDLNPLTDETELSDPVSPFYNTPYPAAPGATATADIPEPYEQPDAPAELSAKERAHLEICESALDVLKLAFWRAGKALRVIRDARLYRETHPSFEAYLDDRWGLSRPYAYNLIDSAPFVEQIVNTPAKDTINERQARELVPLSRDYGSQAAVDLYLTLSQEVAAGNGSAPKITGVLVQKTAAAVRSALPSAAVWDTDTLTTVVRSVLHTTEEPATADTTGDSEFTGWFETESTRVNKLADKVAKRADKHPDEAKAFAEALRQYAKRIDKAISAAGG